MEPTGRVVPRPTPRQGILPLHPRSVDPLHPRSVVEIVRSQRDILVIMSSAAMYVLCVRSDMLGNLSGLIGAVVSLLILTLTFKFLLLFSVFAVAGVGIGVDVCGTNGSVQRRRCRGVLS